MWNIAIKCEDIAWVRRAFLVWGPTGLQTGNLGHKTLTKCLCSEAAFPPPKKKVCRKHPLSWPQSPLRARFKCCMSSFVEEHSMKWLYDICGDCCTSPSFELSLRRSYSAEAAGWTLFNALELRRIQYVANLSGRSKNFLLHAWLASALSTTHPLITPLIHARLELCAKENN